MHPREFIAKHIKATLEKDQFPPRRSRWAWLKPNAISTGHPALQKGRCLMSASRRPAQ